MDRELLQILACPRCRGELVETDDGNHLRCPRCAVRYPVQEGIPILLSDSAESDD